MVEARLARQFSDERHVARGRQPAELDREQEDQHDPEPEIRRRDAPQREQVGAIVPGRVLLHRRDDAGGNADQERDHDRHRGELHRHRQLLRDQLAHRHLDAQRLAEIAGQHALDPVDILNRDRLIELVLLADLRDHGGIALLAGHHQRRIARQQLLQREDQDRHEEQCRDQLQHDAWRESSAWRQASAIPRGEEPQCSLQLQPDHAHQAVRHLLVAFELRGVRDQDACGDRGRGSARRRARSWSAFHRSPCAAPDR